MNILGQDSLHTARTLTVDGQEYQYFSLPDAAIGDVTRLPMTLKVLLENVLRFEDGRSYKVSDAEAIAGWLEKATSEREVPFKPARILMQDFTGVPAVVDLAAMRDGITRLGGNPQAVNPLVPVDLVIDHSVTVDVAGTPGALGENVEREFERNGERYAFLRWGQGAFKNFRVVPPGTGICHQVNLEYLAQAVWTSELGGKTYAYPDTLYGTDSHTTMVNGMGVLGWGVGGIEAEAAMLGQPIAMLIPDVIGFRLTGRLPEGTTATDLVLTVTQMLRKRGVVGKFVEFFGDALDYLPVADRATIANMAPEYGATCGFFPVDQVTLNYLHLTGRDEHRIRLVEAYCRAQGMWRDGSVEPVFTDTLSLDLATVLPSMAGPKRPQDRVLLRDVATSFMGEMTRTLGVSPGDETLSVPVAGHDYVVRQGDVVIAAITSCTNTSNPYVMVAAGLVARKARARGLTPRPWVKTSLAPWLPGCDGISGRRGAERRSGCAGVPDRRLRLHHLHRQFRPARRGAGGGDRIPQTRGRIGIVRQPQFRGARASQRAGELPGQPAAGGRVRAAGQHHGRHHHGAARHRCGGAGRLSARCLADQSGDCRYRARASDAPRIPQALRRRVSRPGAVAGDRGRGIGGYL